MLPKYIETLETSHIEIVPIQNWVSSLIYQDYTLENHPLEIFDTENISRLHLNTKNQNYMQNINVLPNVIIMVE